MDDGPCTRGLLCELDEGSLHCTAGTHLPNGSGKFCAVGRAHRLVEGLGGSLEDDGVGGCCAFCTGSGCAGRAHLLRFGAGGATTLDSDELSHSLGCERN